MKYLNTLIPDIYDQVKKKNGWFNHELGQQFAGEISTRLQGTFGAPERTPCLRLSKMGPMCPKALWASIHAPQEAEPMPPWVEIKFSYGHVLEALVISLAKAAGHEVLGEQDEVTVDGVKGHRDCVIDGHVVDVKSSSSRGFIKFKDGSFRQNDSFGYLDQLDGYIVGSASDPLVRVKDRGALLVIDKQFGHLTLCEHHVRESSIRERIAKAKDIVGCPVPPPCTCKTVPEGRSGNIRLDTIAGYNSFKYFCFPHLRTFIYASGPVFLTKVVREPDVMEVNKFGNQVYA